jgi:hypothetical protein
MSRLQTRLLVQDTCRFYGQVRPEHLKSLEAFDSLYAAFQLERLFYAGASPTVPYLISIVGQLLSIAVSYASISFDAADKAPKFGWILAYFFFFTQPSADDCASRVLLRVPELALQRAVQQANNGDPVLAVVLAQLSAAGALHIVPFVDHTISWQEIFRAHDAADVPLLREDKRRNINTSRHPTATSLPADLASALASYESEIAQLNLL